MFVMKQKKFYLSLAASMMLAVTGFTSCTENDNPAGGDDPIAPIIDPIVDDFDEGSIIKNGSLQGSLLENFMVKEWRTMETQFEGAPNVIIEPTNRDNRCAVVEVRSEDEAIAAGNMFEANGNIAGWDSQFFIVLDESLKLKDQDKIRLSFDIKADVAQKVDIQVEDVAYIDGFPLSNFDVKEDWIHYDSGFVLVNADKKPWWAGGDGSDVKPGFYKIVFNLAKGIHNTVYFDNLRVEVDRYDTFDDNNMVKNGTAKKDNVANFLANDFPDPDGAQQKFVPARIITDPADETNRCFVVGTNNNASAAWDAQFFITLGDANLAFKPGDKFQLKFRYKADKAQTGVSIQAHANRGDYVGNLPGNFNNVSFTDEWQNFDSGEVEVAKDAKPFYTFAINLSNKDLGANNIYIDDVQLIEIERAPEIDWSKIASVEINGDFEDTDVSGFVWKFKENAEDTNHFKFQIQNGIGKDGSRGTFADSYAGEGLDDWSSQFFIVLPKIYAEGTKYQVTFDAKADNAASIDIQQHQEADGDHYINNCGSLNITTEWATYVFDGEAAKSNAGFTLKSFAFNLNKNKEVANRFYFDNIKVKVVEPALE